MPYPSPETVSPEELVEILARLKQLLTNLPSELPLRDAFNSKYSTFLNFSLDPEILDKTEDEVATLGEQLEHIFGWQAHTTGDDIIPIVERGRTICALHPILETYSEKYPENNILKKWVIDVALGAEKVFRTYQVPLPNELGTKRQLSEAIGVDEPVTSSIQSKLCPHIQKAKVSGPGRNPNELIARLVVKYQDDTKKSSWKCAAEGCSHLRQGNAQLERILKHSTTCEFLQESNHDLWHDAINESHKRSLGARLPVEGELDEENMGRVAAGQSQKEVDERPQKKLKGQATLDVSALRAFGKQEKEEQRKVFQARVDHVIMRLVCAHGLAPHIIDSPEWKELMRLPNPLYHPTSGDAFADKHIPHEAV